MTPKIPARVIHTSIRVPCTSEEYATIKRAAKLRGAPSLAAWLRERGASFGLADGLEGLATAEDCKDEPADRGAGRADPGLTILSQRFRALATVDKNSSLRALHYPPLDI